MVGGQISHFRWPFLILGQNNGKKLHCLEIFSNFSRENLVSFLSRLEIFDYLNVSNCLDTHLKILNFLVLSRCTPLESQFVSNGVNLNFNCLDLSRYLSHFLIISRSRLVSTKIRLDPSLVVTNHQRYGSCHWWIELIPVMILPFVWIEKNLIRKQKCSINFDPISFHFSLDHKQWVFVFGFIQESISRASHHSQLLIHKQLLNLLILSCHPRATQ